MQLFLNCPSVLHEDYYGSCTGKNSTRIADRIARSVFITDVFFQSHSSPWTATISALPLTPVGLCRFHLLQVCAGVLLHYGPYLHGKSTEIFI